MSAHLMGHTSLAEMVSTHVDVYRNLLKKALADAPPPTHDTDDASYYRHELHALVDIEAACMIEMGRSEGEATSAAAPSIKPERLRELLCRFRGFVIANATQWKIRTNDGQPTNHHNPIWAEIAEAVDNP